MAKKNETGLKKTQFMNAITAEICKIMVEGNYSGTIVLKGLKNKFEIELCWGTRLFIWCFHTGRVGLTCSGNMVDIECRGDAFDYDSKEGTVTMDDCKKTADFIKKLLEMGTNEADVIEMVKTINQLPCRYPKK